MAKQIRSVINRTQYLSVERKCLCLFVSSSRMEVLILLSYLTLEVSAGVNFIKNRVVVGHKERNLEAPRLATHAPSFDLVAESK